MNDTCKTIRPTLAEYADDGLTEAAVPADVRAHLARCESCREHWQRLGRSLELARAIWAEAAEQYERRPAVGQLPAERQVQRHSSTWTIRLLVPLAAAAIALVVLLPMRWQGLEPAQRVAGPATSPRSPARTPIRTIQELDRELERQVASARLAKAASILASVTEAPPESVAPRQAVPPTHTTSPSAPANRTHDSLKGESQ